MSLIYTPIYAAILAILMLVLATKVVLTRRKLRIGVGDKGDGAMLKVIRVHGNATEYVPITLILLALAELNGASAYLINSWGIAFVVGRLIHAYGLGRSIGVSFGRFYGTILTWLVILSLAIYLLVTSFMALI
ncbi:MAPEG family protein [Kangiella sp. TOML190]|uniref:MAPEG family protein n=1 Tax=Kangiella sp. TOML190 TaxID=2931351 RepID=UPI00203DC6AF|nr:MAPEG family protein [Kangiella sp. TOML190]